MRVRIGLVFAVCLLNVYAAYGRVDRVVITSRSDIANGRSFGNSGPYEKIVGRVYFKVDPQNIHNRVIVDLDKAPRDPNGDVEFSADLFVLKPKAVSRGNGAMIFEVSNRGGKRLLNLVNGANYSPTLDEKSDFGDGWLMRQGYTWAVVGWQWDVVDDPNLARLYAPVAREKNGEPISGLLRDDFSVAEKKFDVPLGHIIVGNVGGKEYPVADPDDTHNVLTVRDTPEGERRAIPRSEWSFGQLVNGKLVESNRHLHLDSGFEPGKIYELIYVVRDPVVAGLGLAAVRDFVSYAKYDTRAVAPAKRVYGEGISQTGRFLRHFLWAGFNADERGRQAFDGVIAHVAGAGRGSFNHRFAQPSRDAQPMSAVFYPTDVFPFTDLPETDAVTGATAGLLDRATAEKVVPKIFYSNTSYEYWGRAASLIHTSVDGKQDAKIADNTRVYMLTGLQHFTGPFPPEFGTGDLHGQFQQNPNPVRWYWRAMITNMDAWVRDGILPPPSRYPRISQGTLVPLTELNFPRLKGVRVPQHPLQPWRLDFGPRWTQGIIDHHPPRVGPQFTVLVPQVNADGNDLGGVALPEISVPLATYTPWNLRNPLIGALDRMVSFLGSYLPLTKTRAARTALGDPRISIEERYKSRQDYIARYGRAAQELVKQRWLLKEDVPTLMQRAQQEWDYAMR